MDKLEWQRQHRIKTNNADTHKYEKTINGFLMRLYRNMQSRVTGVQKKKAHLYKGLELLDREPFYRWAISNKDFNKLYNMWVLSEYDRKLCPSVNRIDPGRGYELDNMEFITHSENSRLGAVSRVLKYGQTLHVSL
jgi:hypothetical protein